MGAAVGAITSGIQTGVEFNQVGEEWKYNTNENQNNQRIAEIAAQDALGRGEIDAGKVRRQGSELVARQKLAYANSGVDASVGTAADVQADTSAQTELDAQTVRNNASREAWGFKQESEKYKRKQVIDSSRARTQQTGVILKGLSNFANMGSSGSGSSFMGGGGGAGGGG